MTVMSITRLLLCAVASGPAAEDPIRWEPLGEPGNGGWVVSLAISPHDSRVVLAGGDMLGLARSADRGETWTPAQGLQTYEMGDVTWSSTQPDEVWAGSMNGPYRSTDGGQTWTSRRQGMPEPSGGNYSQPIEKILYVPGAAGRLLAFGGSYREWGNAGELGAVWESVDDGATWQRIAKITPSGPVDDLMAAGANITSASFGGGAPERLYVVADARVYVSEDLGRTWAPRNDGLPPAAKSRIAVHPADPDVAYLGVGNWQQEGEALRMPGGVYQTADAGRTWRRTSEGLGAHRSEDANLTSRYSAVALSPADPSIVWTCDGAYNGATIYRSRDAGGSWQPAASKGDVAFRLETACHAGLTLTGLVADPADPQAVFGFGSEYLVRSVDGGRTWIDASSRRPDPARPRYWRGRGWNGWCCTNIEFNPFRRNQAIVQSLDAGRGWLSDDGMRTFRYLSEEVSPWCAGQDAAFTADGRIYVTTGQFGGFAGVICAEDFGQAARVAIGPMHGLPEHSWGGAGTEGDGVYAQPNDSRHVWAAIGGSLYHSTDAGESWRVLSKRGYRAIAGDPTQPGRFYVTASDGVYVTDDGRRFANIGGPRPAGRGTATVDARGHLYVCQFREGRAGLWRYAPAPGGGRWERLLDEPLAYACAVDPTEPQRLLLTTSQDPYNDFAGGNGVWISADGGASWAPANRDLPMRRATTAAFNPFAPEQVVIGTFGMGCFRATWPKDYRPVGPRRYVGEADDARHAVPPPPGVDADHVVRDFGQAGFDYLYGEGWPEASVSAGEQQGEGYREIDATEAGGGGLVLHGADIAPEGQTHLELSVMLLPGNEVDKLGVNLIAGGRSQSLQFDLGSLPIGEIRTVAVPLGGVPAAAVDQIQIAGTNFGSTARLRARLYRLTTNTPK